MGGVLVLCAIAALFSSRSVAAAGEFVWLVFRDGSRIAVQPRWTIKPPLIVLNTAEGKLVSARLAEIDLAATQALTEATDPNAATVLEAPRPVSVFPNVAQHAKEHGLKDGGTFTALGSASGTTSRIVPTPPTAKTGKQVTPELRESAAEWMRTMNTLACTAGRQNSSTRQTELADCVAKVAETFCRDAYDEKTAARESCLQRVQAQRIGKN